jgi:hypothetical protein
MPAPKAQQTREEVLALARQGHSVRAIETMLKGRGMTIGKSAIAELVKLYRAGAVAEAARAPEPPKGPPPASAGPTAAADGAGAPPSVEVLDPAEVANLDLAELVRIAGLFTRVLEIATNAGDVRVVAGLLASRITIAREIARLRPPVLPDPAKDPANLAARDELRARLGRAVEAARQSDAALEQLRAHLQRAEEEAARRRPAEPEKALEGP